MRRVFADTVFWIGLISAKDSHHAGARDAQQQLGDARLITTDSVFGEVLAHLSPGPNLRRSAVEIVHWAMGHPNIDVVHQDAHLFNRAVVRYAMRLDKTYSLVDCISMEVMDDYAITDILTADRDFEREGYTRLMRNPNEP